MKINLLLNTKQKNIYNKETNLILNLAPKSNPHGSFSHAYLTKVRGKKKRIKRIFTKAINQIPANNHVVQ